MENKKSEKFKELATRRVRRVIKDIRLVGNLANRNNYRYTDDQVHKIIRALNAEIRALRQRFESGGNQDEDLFFL